MRMEYLARVRSLIRGERMRGWTDLPDEPEAAHHVLSRENRSQLAAILANEQDEGVHRHGMDILAGFSCAECMGRVERQILAPAVPIERSLDHWMWSDFCKSSAVFRASEPAYERRDPDAVECLARRLGYKDFPELRFYPVPKGEDIWQEIVTEQALETCCFVGRLGLFGKQAVEKVVNPQTRFRFLRHAPPPAFPTGDELKKYYVIEEFDGDRLVNEYRTSDTDGVRTDYGIVQRYPIFLGTHYITVLLCAGLSSLGTVGAARWAALDLGLPQDPQTKVPVMQPKIVGPHSRLEALVRTIGVSRSPIWRPSKIELVGLYVDHFQWSPEDLQWHDNQLHVVEVQLRGGKPVGLLIDGVRANLNSSSQNFRLAVAFTLSIGQNGGGVDVDQLARDVSIWGGHELPPKTVKQRLHNLDKHTFKRLLTIDDQVRLDAQVVIVEE
jgi:hypothetical protein